MRARRAILTNATVAVLTLLTLAPLIYMVIVSFMPRGESGTLPIPLWPSRWSLENYHELLVRRRCVAAESKRNNG